MRRYSQMRTFRITAVVALCVVGGVLAGGSACSSSSQDGADKPKDGESARVSADLVAQVNEILQLRSSSVVTLDIDATPGLAASVNLPIAGAQYTLDLHPQSVRSANYQLKVQLADGSLVDAEPGPVRTLRGTVVGVEGSVVAASMEEDGLHARIFLSDDEQYWVEPVASRVPRAGPNHYVVYHNDDIIAPEKACGLDHLPDALGNRGVLGTVRQTRAGACGTGLCVAELAADADYEYFLDYGSVAAVESRINSVINAVNVQYERDVDITQMISAIIVRTAEPDPYSFTDATQLIFQFRDHWLANEGHIQRDMAQLFTGKELNSSTIGIAWLNAVCTEYGFSVVQSDYDNNFGCTTDLTAHELGHNWGADHCLCSTYTMNAFITCANRFEPTLSIPEMVSFRDSRSCLEGQSACETDPDCDDGEACNGVETCDVPSGQCIPGTPLNCDDSLVCTVDGCSNSTCTHSPLNCDDGNACTNDDCVEPGGCVHVSIDPCCGDGNCAGGIEDCGSCATDCIGNDGVSGCGNGTCEPGEDCLSCPQDCNGRQNGKPSKRYCCRGDGAGGGTNPIDCGDSRCTSGGNQCGSVDPYCCGDGWCDVPEDETTCAIDCVVSCTDGTECNDNVSCTDDTCDLGICVSTPNDANCPDDGLFCNGDEVCDDQAGCSSAGDPCPAGTLCNEGTDVCDPQACGSNGTSCASDGECCSNKCKNDTCRGN